MYNPGLKQVIGTIGQAKKNFKNIFWAASQFIIQLTQLMKSTFIEAK